MCSRETDCSTIDFASQSAFSDEREFLTMVFGQRTGMYIGRTTLHGVTSFLTGYDEAARRHGGQGLSGFREWLMVRHPRVGQNLSWGARVTQVALDDSDYTTPHRPYLRTNS